MVRRSFRGPTRVTRPSIQNTLGAPFRVAETVPEGVVGRADRPAWVHGPVTGHRRSTASLLRRGRGRELKGEAG